MEVFKLALLEEAKEFLQSLPHQAYKKILYNIDRVTKGEKNNELFKKLENCDIWEFRTLYNGIAYRAFCILGYGKPNIGCCNSWNNKKDPKDS